MVIRVNRFNMYFALALVAGMVCGCQTAAHKDKILKSTLGVHQEVSHDPTGKTEEIEVGRDHPVKFTIKKEPFLDEGHVKSAKVVDVLGGFALSIEFDRQGKWLLEEYSVGSGGRHFAIFSQFTPPNEDTLNEGRWLAAPRISQRISDGVLLITVDASREEAERIALGLSNVGRATHDGEESKW
jgi:hypothetical protein